VAAIFELPTEAVYSQHPIRMMMIRVRELKAIAGGVWPVSAVVTFF
jgi:hypothetical protein